MNLKGKIAVITGATRGLGFAFSEKLASLGATVIMACRERESGIKSVEKLKAKGYDVVFKQCDFESVSEIDSLGASLASEYNHLDILINNAGVSIEPLDTTIETLDISLFDKTMAVNLRGTLWTISRLLPLLKKSPQARIINISSGLAQLSSPKTGPQISYSISKTAVNGLTWTFAHHLKNTNVSIFCTDPGWVKTDMGGPEAWLDIEQGIDTPIWLATEDISKLQSGLFYRERKVLPW